MPYPVDQAVAALAGVKHLILVGAVPPVGFFAYPGKPGRMYPADCGVHVLARPEQDGRTRWSRLAAALGVEPVDAARPSGTGRAAARGRRVRRVRAERGRAAAGERDRGRRERQLRPQRLFR